GEFCDDQGMKYIDTLRINIPDTKHGLDRPIKFSLTFGQLEYKASAYNEKTGKLYKKIKFYVEE
ncbi:11769_t:CDS:1, partial [Dentiscutata heterogama]